MSLPTRRTIKRRKKDKKTSEFIKIPRSIFEKTLEVINDSQHIIWSDRNSACSKPIHRSFDNDLKGMRSDDLSSKISLARTCLLRRDVRNLGKTLSVINLSGSRVDCRWYPLCVKDTMGHPIESLRKISIDRVNLKR
ncbi:PREDICTED: uncharacterized protein LOC108370592 isoform X2 [Rhagoletis zephyria]|uniref:uncharacterized protein LOC108370592 isoform X2 n=1 Tax=Rhagoletis zephyria TaxID=28612 RepID=UPI0008113197|nr:PREDICTED: uncharacterized protein LOC108370592 isoform X2 [Rhagoletis zephyria]XP_036321010.1 uncharacterized protein LOC118735396 isoform X2 [Rhagoletis pomonella]